MVNTPSTHLFNPIYGTTARMTPNANYDLWVIVMCQYFLTKCSKCTTLDGLVLMGETACKGNITWKNPCDFFNLPVKLRML